MRKRGTVEKAWILGSEGQTFPFFLAHLPHYYVWGLGSCSRVSFFSLGKIWRITAPFVWHPECKVRWREPPLCCSPARLTLRVFAPLCTGSEDESGVLFPHPPRALAGLPPGCVCLSQPSVTLCCQMTAPLSLTATPYPPPHKRSASSRCWEEGNTINSVYIGLLMSDPPFKLYGDICMFSRNSQSMAESP